MVLANAEKKGDVPLVEVITTTNERSTSTSHAVQDVAIATVTKSGSAGKSFNDKSINNTISDKFVSINNSVYDQDNKSLTLSSHKSNNNKKRYIDCIG